MSHLPITYFKVVHSFSLVKLEKIHTHRDGKSSITCLVTEFLGEGFK